MKRFSDDELEALLNDLESDLAERKQSFKGETPKKARQAVCAFANDLPNYNQPGVLFIGAKDDGTPSQEPITDELLRSLADMKTDGNILPLPVISVEKRTLKGSDMAVVTVQPSDMPPVKYEGRIWIRTGPRLVLSLTNRKNVFLLKREDTKISPLIFILSQQQSCQIYPVWFLKTSIYRLHLPLTSLKLMAERMKSDWLHAK